MSFANKLFGSNTFIIPAAQPASLDGEIRILDAIEAIDPAPWKIAYWRTLHPLVQACLLYRASRELEADISISSSDASSVFYRWGYPVGCYTAGMTAQQEELMAQYASCKEALWQQKQEAEQRFRRIDAKVKSEKDQAWQAYWEHYETLPSSLKPLVAWELAKRGLSQMRSGFHSGWKVTPPFPVWPCGWTSYQDPKWGAMDGVAFRIEKSCFGDRKPLLYYLDDDSWPGADREDTDLALIREYSSGISGVRVERRKCRGWDNGEREQRVVLFELDPAAVKQTVNLRGETVSTKEAGEYLFVLPRCGEFYCVLGEVRDGVMIPLHKDDFCMK